MDLPYIYHTISTKGDLATTLKSAPFLCEKSNSWLGKGYYFWEHKNDASFWGKAVYHNKYRVLKTSYSIEPSQLLDLTIESDKQDLVEALRELENQSKTRTNGIDRITVSEVITYLKEFLKDRFPYKAIRSGSITDDISQNGSYIYYTKKGNEALPLKSQLGLQRIQLCFLDIDNLSRPMILEFSSKKSDQL